MREPLANLWKALGFDGCDACDGAGVAPAGEGECPKCEGSGVVRRAASGPALPHDDLRPEG